MCRCVMPQLSCCCATGRGISRCGCLPGWAAWRSPRGMSVFPGGRVEDADTDLPIVGSSMAQAAARFGTGERDGPGADRRRGARAVRGDRHPARRSPTASRRSGDGAARGRDGPAGLRGTAARRRGGHRRRRAASVGTLGNSAWRGAALRHPVLPRRRCRPASMRVTSPRRPRRRPGSGSAPRWPPASVARAG